NTGVYYIHKEDFDKSLQYTQKALNIFEALGNDSMKVVSSCYHNMGGCFEKKGKTENAIQHYQKALNIRLSAYGEKSFKVLITYLRLGMCYTTQTKYNKGLQYFEDALEIANEILGQYNEKTSFAYSCIGTNYEKRGQEHFVQARNHWQKAIKINQHLYGVQYVQISRDYFYIAHTYTIEKEYAKALFINQKALESLDAKFSSFQDEQLYELAIDFLNTSKYNLRFFSVLEQKAAILYQLYEENEEDLNLLKKSFEIYSLLSDLSPLLYDEATSESAKLTVHAKSKIVFEKSITLGLAFHSISSSVNNFFLSAFELMEKSKARLLFANLQGTAAKLESEIPQELLQKERKLHKEWKILEKKMKIATSEDKTLERHKTEQWEKQLFDIQRSYEQLVQKLEKDFPKYYQLKRQLQIPNIKDLQSLLLERADYTMISYFVGEETLYICVLQSQYFEVIKVVITNDLTDKVQAFVRAINFSFQEECIELGCELYEILIAPIAAILQKNTAVFPFNNGTIPAASTPTLLIFPDGILSQLPFEALLTQPIDSFHPPKYLPYLLLDYNIQYHYSASLWKHGLEQAKKIENQQDSYVGFAPVYADALLNELETEMNPRAAYHERSTRSVNIRGKVFQELLYSEKEVVEIQQLFEKQGFTAQSFVHEQASIQQFQQTISHPKYIHISAHSFPNSTEANLSGIVFSPNTNLNPDSSDYEEMDCIFYLQDAYLLSLQADLVVLSCCETGIGQLAKGEGMLAMNRGFLAAGAKNVIYTLFKVYDEVSSVLTQKLFQYILEGKPYAVALRLAKLEMLQGETAMPKFWAGYVMIGV
ncbi:MAG: CHAT domain-containing protein, partial [Chitinophagales bacterium]